MPRYDLVIRGGRVVDGTGLPSYTADVGIVDGKIAVVGRVTEAGRREIDADGLIVCPGFIDHHTHLDAQVYWDPLITSCCYHGVTTVVMGNCGFTLAPLRAEDLETMLGTLARVEGMDPEALRLGVRFGGGSFGDYLASIDRPLGINVGGLVGHCAVRQYVMGDDAVEREATEEEIECMREVVRQSLREGAIGFSTNRNPRHFRLDGMPVPSRLASDTEIHRIVEVLAEEGVGMVQAIQHPPQPEDVEWFATLSRRSGVPVMWQSVLHRWIDPDGWKPLLEATREQFQKGGRAYPLTNAVPIEARYTLRNATVFDEFPTWRSIMLQPIEERRRLFADRELRQKLRFEAVEDPKPSGAFSKHWDKVYILTPALEQNRHLKGLSVAEFAARQGKDILDAFLDLSLEEDLQTEFIHANTNGDDDAVGAILANPFVVIGMSDAGAHVAYDAEFGYCTNTIGKYVRERGDLSLEYAVMKLTGMIAHLYGLTDRGTIAPGKNADICIFDFDTIGPREPEVAYDFPGGTRRMIQHANGIHYTIVNGVPVIEGSEHTGEMPGRIVRNRLAAQAAATR